MSVSGKVYATDFSSPTPNNLAQANSDQQTALNFAMQEAPPTKIYGAVDLIGVTLTPGIYKFTGAVSLSGTLTLVGNCSDVFVFQMTAAFGVAAAPAQIILKGGLTASSVFFAVDGAVTIG